MSDAVLVEHVGDGHRAAHAEPARAAQRDELRPRRAACYDAFDELADDRSCRVIVLTGAGRGFCAGPRPHRRREPARRRRDSGRAQAGMTVQKLIAGLVPKMRAMPQPIIAAVNGAASGGGLALALASDVRIAAAIGALQRRVHPGRALGLRHRRVVDAAAARSARRARSSCCSPAASIDAAEADRIGLVTRVVPDGDGRRRRRSRPPS